MAWASLLISLAALVVAILSAWYALREARIGNALPGAMEFLGQYRGLAADRRLIVSTLASVADRPQDGMSDLPDEIHDKVVRISHYLDQLGVLVHHNLIDAKMVAGSIGDSIIGLWEVISPYIEAERHARKGDYQTYFEDLAREMKDIHPAKVRAGLKRFRD